MVVCLLIIVIHRVFFLNQPPLPIQLPLEIFFSRQVKYVFGREKLFAVVQHGIPGNGLILFRAENQPDGRIVILGDKQVIEHSNIAVHLPHVLVGQFADLQIDQQIALQDAVIENKIDIEECVFILKAFLTGDKGETFTQFK